MPNNEWEKEFLNKFTVADDLKIHRNLRDFDDGGEHILDFIREQLTLARREEQDAIRTRWYIAVSKNIANIDTRTAIFRDASPTSITRNEEMQ